MVQAPFITTNALSTAIAPHSLLHVALHAQNRRQRPSGSSLQSANTEKQQGQGSLGSTVNCEGHTGTTPSPLQPLQSTHLIVGAELQRDLRFALRAPAILHDVGDLLLLLPHHELLEVGLQRLHALPHNRLNTAQRIGYGTLNQDSASNARESADLLLRRQAVDFEHAIVVAGVIVTG